MATKRDILTAFAGMGLVVATPSAWAQSAFSTRPIQPQNPLEEDFLAAFEAEAMRPVFRTRFLESQVCLALASTAEDAAPLQVTLRNTGRAAAVYTSAERLTSVLGVGVARVSLTGRQALERTRGSNVAINYRLIPMLTLEPADVDSFLLIPG